MDELSEKNETVRYCAMTPDQMLIQDKKSFEIHYASVQSVEMKQPGFLRTGEIKFKVAGENQRFMLPTHSKVKFGPHISTLQQAIRGKVSVK